MVPCRKLMFGDPGDNVSIERSGPIADSEWVLEINVKQEECDRKEFDTFDDAFRYATQKYTGKTVPENPVPARALLKIMQYAPTLSKSGYLEPMYHLIPPAFGHGPYLLYQQTGCIQPGDPKWYFDTAEEMIDFLAEKIIK